MRERRNYELFGKEIILDSIEKTGEKNVYSAVYGQTPAYIISEEAPGESFTGKTEAMIVRGSEEIPVVVPPQLYGTAICFECNTVHELGSLLKEGDKLFPKFEKTSGAVMFTEKDGEIRYLIIKNESGHIGFPKGHIEYGEDELMTAEREVFEETGIRFRRFGDFREEYTFPTKEKCIKTGAFFISHYDYRAPTIQHEEILDDWLLTYEKAMELLNFAEDRELLKRANEYIIKNYGRDEKL